MKNYQNKEWLSQKYVVEKLTCKEISDLENVSATTIGGWLVKFNIPRRRSGIRKVNESYRDKKWIHLKYVIEKLTIKKISELANVHPNTIWENMIRLNIPRRKGGIESWTPQMRESIVSKLQGRKPMLGKTHSEETKRKMSQDRKGSGNSNWKEGITVKSRHFRKSREYWEWRKQILQRDAYKCQYLGCNLETNIAHHIKPIKDFPELKLDVDNGMAVCHSHHMLIHKNLKDEKLKNRMD